MPRPNYISSQRSKEELLVYAQNNPTEQIALTSLLLGVSIGASIGLSFHPSFSFKPLFVYIVSLASFHFLEFYITSKYQTSKASVDSFIIFSNGSEYLIAHSVAILETTVELVVCSIWPNTSICSFKTSAGLGSNFAIGLRLIQILGLSLILFGQVLRSMAMVTAGESFSHVIANDKKQNHVLVTDGIYRIVRHPSYVGFFYWALGTQLLLLNPVSVVLFAAALYIFFSRRIRYEEYTLLRFFGDEYAAYMQRTPVGIPFI
ncbi:unnamed protein product [Ambrosiozyma monospora]|uniref:Unnamed protein product n=1 Tax=Ambrosiozyma monospora TaxID=43982 RepID=A0ACB5SU10_AMBMO|nr:unnamed protein product [Ambrosiozyma monospora]